MQLLRLDPLFCSRAIVAIHGRLEQPR
jgi:hypothetical protein